MKMIEECYYSPGLDKMLSPTGILILFVLVAIIGVVFVLWLTMYDRR